MSANSIPSPFVRATSLPANTCVSAAWMTRWSTASRGYVRSSGRVSAVASQVSSPSGSRARTKVGPITWPPQRSCEQRQLELALLACGEPQGDGVPPFGERHAFRKADVDVEPVDRRRRAQRDAGADLVSFERAALVERDVDAQARRRREREPRPEREQERRGHRDELRASE